MDNAILERQKPKAQIHKQIKMVREQLIDLMDYLDLLEARVQNKGKRTLSIEEARQRLGLERGRGRQKK